MYLCFGWSFFILGIGFILLSWLNTCNFIVKFDLFSLKSLEFLKISFYFDHMSCYFLFTLCFMVGSVYFFCKSYMSNSNDTFRFCSLIFMFVMSMFILILSPKLISFVIGWDGLGFTSFLLVAWFSSFSSFSASLKTFLTNRLGDSFFVMALVLMFVQGDFVSFFCESVIWNWIGILLMFASFTKSAQWPFSSWLPSAMEAPTPISALVHSSTLVTAGIYLLIRISSTLSMEILFYISIVGLYTMLFSSVCAFFEFDSKKIIAYSTLSQLGFMCLCVGTNLMGLGFFYLLIHACFKALMFISMGIYMTYSNHFQDIRSLNSLSWYNPVMYLNLAISVFSMSGFPFISCFVFKHPILNSLGLGVSKTIFYLLVLGCSILTSAYSFRLLSLSSMDSCFLVSAKTYDTNWLVFLPLYVCSLTLGFSLSNNLNTYFKLKVYYSLSFFICVLIGFSMGFKAVWLDFYEYVEYLSLSHYMFMCEFFAVSLKDMFTSGSNMYLFLDKGMFCLDLVEHLNSFFSNKYNKIFILFLSMNWLGFMLFSYILLGFLFFV